MSEEIIIEKVVESNVEIVEDYGMKSVKGNERISKLFADYEEKLRPEDMQVFINSTEKFLTRLVELTLTKTYGKALNEAVLALIRTKVVGIAKKIFSKPVVNGEVLVHILYGSFF